jgi:hypothetical protein
MNTAKFRAIMLVVKLVRITGMALVDACRAAGNHDGVVPDWLYRELTQ